MRYLRVIAFLTDSISNRVYKLNTILLVFAVCVIGLAGCGGGSEGGNESSNHPPFVLTELDVYIDENDPMAMFDLPKGMDSDGQPLSYRVTSIPNQLFGIVEQADGKMLQIGAVFDEAGRKGLRVIISGAAGDKDYLDFSVSDGASETSGTVIFHISPRDRPLMYYSSAYNAFTGWEWIIDTTTGVSLGRPKVGTLRNYQFKIHPIDHLDPNEWSEGEFFCDPDSILFYEVEGEPPGAVYLPYLAWESDLYIAPEWDWARLSAWHRIGDGFVHEAGTEPPIEIREDRSLVVGEGFVEIRVYLTNRADRSVSVAYVYQDAAYLWLPQQDQSSLTGYGQANGVKHWGTFWFDSVGGYDGYAGLVDLEHDVMAGISVLDYRARIGVLPKYLFFGFSPAPEGSDLPGEAEITLPVADLDTVIASAIQPIGYPVDFKNRCVLFQATLKPQQQVVFVYRLHGFAEGRGSNAFGPDYLSQF
jgi:hypothetical protein